MLKKLLFYPNLRRAVKQSFIKTISLDRLSTEESRTNIILPETFATPEAVQMNFPPEVKHLQRETLTTPRAYTTVLEGVIYCPEYRILLTPDRKLISESFNTLKPREDFLWQRLFFRKVEKVAGTGIVYHHLDNNFFHTAIENVPRLYLTLQHDIIQSQKCNVQLLQTRHFSTFDQFFLEKMLPSNVTINKLKEGRLYQIERLIVSTFLSRGRTGCLPSFCHKAIYPQFMPSRPRQKKHRIFISRKKAYNGRRILNKDKLLALLSEFGFVEYLLEELSIPEQIELFYDAEAVVAAHGAGLTNLIFADRAKVIELFPSQFVITEYYYLSKCMGHDYQYWCDCRPTYNSNFSVDLSTLKQMLEKAFSR